MTNDAILVVKCLFETIWRLFNSWCIPGTNVTPMDMALFLVAADIGLYFILRLFDINPVSSNLSGDLNFIKASQKTKRKIGF